MTAADLSTERLNAALAEERAQPAWKRVLLSPVTRGLAIAGFVIGLTALVGQGQSLRLPQGLHLRFDPEPLLGAPWVIQVHVASAVGALLLGAALMTLRKGVRLHRVMGWSWAVLMGVAAVSSLFIMRTNPGHFSFIHGLSAWTIVMLPMALLAARRHNVKRHRRIVMGMYFGGVVLAGLLAFLPGRIMWSVIVGA